MTLFGFQCGNYGIGGHYFIHPDYNNPQKENQYEPGRPGNRYLRNNQCFFSTMFQQLEANTHREKAFVLYSCVRAVFLVLWGGFLL